jgi:hypothetical protein
VAVQSPPFALQNSSHSAALFRQAASSLVLQGGPLGTAEYVVSAQGTPNMSVSVAAGRAWIPGTQVSTISGQHFSTQAMYFVLNDAPATVTISTANATNPRIDVVYVAVQDAYYSGSSNASVIGVVTGTPAASPVAPAVPSNAIALAQVAVAANATSITSGNVTNLTGQQAVVKGGTYVGQSTTRPSAAYIGQGLYETDTGREYVFDQTGTWRYVGGIAPPIAAITSYFSGWSAYSGHAPGVYLDGSGLVHITGAVLNGSLYNPQDGGTHTILTLPAGYRPGALMVTSVTTGSTGNASGPMVDLQIGADGVVQVVGGTGNSVITQAAHWLNDIPAFHPAYTGAVPLA